MAFSRFARSASAGPLLAVVVPAGPSKERPPARERRTKFSPTPHLTTDQYVRLLACIDDHGGVTTLDEISRALPLVQQPISAVFDLCDSGVLNVDWESALDGDTHVWRIDHRVVRLPAGM